MQISFPELLEALPIAHDLIGDEKGIWEAWNFDPEFIIPIVLLGVVYANGLRRWTDRTRAHPWWRTALYYSGLLVLLLSVESPLDRLGEHHFSMHMIQHEMVVMAAAPLLLLGAPTTPMLRGMPRWLRLGVVRRLAKRDEVRWTYRQVTHPLLAVVVISATFWLWHLGPGWYDAALEDDVIHDLQHFNFWIAGVLLWWNIVDPKPLQSRLAYIPRMLYVFAAGVPKHFPRRHPDLRRGAAVRHLPDRAPADRSRPARGPAARRAHHVGAERDDAPGDDGHHLCDLGAEVRTAPARGGGGTRRCRGTPRRLMPHRPVSNATIRKAEGCALGLSVGSGESSANQPGVQHRVRDVVPEQRQQRDHDRRGQHEPDEERLREQRPGRT